MGLLELTAAKVKDEMGKLNYPIDYLNAIAAALARYSKHRPRILVSDFPGNGGHDYELPADWQPGLSSPVSVECPAGLIPEVLLDRRDYRLYQTPAGTGLRILPFIPTAAETIRLTYNGLHDEESLPESDLDAVASLAASLLCAQLAAAFGQSSSPTMQADVVNYGSKTDEYRRLAAHWEGQYKEQLGIKENDSTPAAMATAAPAESSRTRLTHGRR